MSQERTIQEKAVDAIRVLSVEAITKANSGHPGICLDAAPIGFEVFADFLNYSYKNPKWHNRDRFVLSAGHGSALLYTLLHLFGFNVTREDLKNFRQFGSKTPGHPEYRVTDGIEVSTGPLGQGIANAVGMAVAEAHLAAVFNREGFPVVDHYTYVLCGDGCLEEGISYEACSFAGTQKLGKLILLYDKNDISIEGDIKNTFNEDIPVRFKMQGWHVEQIDNANDLSAIKNAITKAKGITDKPSIIICKSVIGYGTPLAGTAAIHGSPLSEKDLSLTKDVFGWTEPPFEVLAAVENYCLGIARQKLKAEEEWNTLFADYTKKHPELAKEYKCYFEVGFNGKINDVCNAPEATRVSGGKVINELAKKVPNLMSGSADLSPSTKTDIKGGQFFSPENRAGRNIHFGIREHAMAAICNGVAVHGGLKIICSTFLAFCDYMKGAMRMSAIMKLPVIYVLTHDSIGVGEDGPTHQPIEQLAMMRAMPDINVFRPCDYSETVTAFKFALKDNVPTAIVLSRQNLKQFGKGAQADKGGYVIKESKGNPDVLLIATGSEVELCVKAKELLEKENVKARVISLPCVGKFNGQSTEYKNSVMPKNVKARVCVEAASPLGWREFAGDYGEVIAMNTFGLSGDYKALYNHFGFTPENIKDKAINSISLCKENDDGK